jgi:hypothetical protein
MEKRKVLDEIKVRNYKLKKDDYVNSINYIKKELSKAYLLENKVKLGRLFLGNQKYMEKIKGK